MSPLTTRTPACSATTKQPVTSQVQHKEYRDCQGTGYPRGTIQTSSSTRGNMTELDIQERAENMTQSNISSCICHDVPACLLLGCGGTLYMPGEIKLFFFFK